MMLAVNQLHAAYGRIPILSGISFRVAEREIVGAGRPTCSLCGYPIDADGHICTLPEV